MHLCTENVGHVFLHAVHLKWESIKLIIILIKVSIKSKTASRLFVFFPITNNAKKIGPYDTFSH